MQSWDTANKPGELADYSVCTTFGVKNKHFYLLHVLRKKFGYPDLKRAVLEQSNLFRPNVILIEDKASGTQLIQELREAGVYTVVRYKPEGDKVMRLDAQTSANKPPTWFLFYHMLFPPKSAQFSLIYARKGSIGADYRFDRN